MLRDSVYDAKPPRRRVVAAGGRELDAARGAGAALSRTAFPCERLCWELDARFGRGRPTTLTSIDTSDETDLAAIGAPLIRCAKARAAQCRAADDASPESTASERVTWTSAFLECAGLPADFGLLD